MVKFNTDDLSSMEIYDRISDLQQTHDDIREELDVLTYELACRGQEAEMKYGIMEKIRVGDKATITNGTKDQKGLEGVIADITNQTVVLNTPQGVVKKRKRNVRKVYDTCFI